MQRVPTFDEWLDDYFYYQERDSDCDAEVPSQELPTAVKVEYLTRMFSAPLQCIGRFSDRKLNKGLWYLLGRTDDILALVDDSVPEAERVACVESMRYLYTDLFAVRCTDVTSHWESHGDEVSPLNGVCYMWWDILPISGMPEDPSRANLDDAILEVMEEALNIPSQACQESALHGLGHWASDYPERVRSAVAGYLAIRPVRSPLREYALAAAEGRVQ